jgi:phenylacetate-CoA ligase
MLTKKRAELLKNSSSGSSGFQTSVYWSHKEQAINRATQMLWWEWAGYRLGDPLIQTGINPHRPGIKKLKDIFFRTKYISAFSHSEKEVLKCLSSIGKSKNYTLAGYASSLYVMAKIAKKNNLQIQFKNAVCWGDKLFEHYRKTIDTEFGCSVHETYGSAEGLMMGSQKDLPYMYIMSPNVVTEILDDDGNEVADGEMGHVVVTNLNAYAMPLIRYRIGDLAIKLPKEKCPSSRMLNLPIFQKVIGRDTDLIKTASGKYMVVHSFTGIFEHVPEIEQFCVIQNELSGIIIQFVPGKTFTQKCLELVKEKILSELNESFDIEFKAVEFIVASKSGKPQIIISNLK